MELWGITDSGGVRQHNQDVFLTYYDENCGAAVAVVCDGMGGAKAGNIASLLAAESFMAHIREYLTGCGAAGDNAQAMMKAAADANTAVYEKSIGSDEYYGMGTTLAAVISGVSGETVINIGDSRVYHITRGRIRQVTRDHSVVEDMIARGDITRAQAWRHPNKHLITRALGTNAAETPDLFSVRLKRGEYILLCSDGLSNIVGDGEILHEIRRGGGARRCCEALVGIALSRGAPDNVTAVVLKK